MRRFVTWLALTVGWIPAVEATLSVRVGFEDLMVHSQRVFLGTVVTVRDEAPVPGRNVPSVVTKFRVEEVYKGSVGSTLVIRQFGVADTRSRLHQLVGLRTFRPGERVVVFLSSESPIGLSSPIGFGQGVFRLEKGEGEEALLANSLGNRGLFRRTRSRSLEKMLAAKGWTGEGPVRLRLKDLKGLIAAFEGGSR